MLWAYSLKVKLEFYNRIERQEKSINNLSFKIDILYKDFNDILFLLTGIIASFLKTIVNKIVMYNIVYIISNVNFHLSLNI